MRRDFAVNRRHTLHFPVCTSTLLASKFNSQLIARQYRALKLDLIKTGKHKNALVVHTAAARMREDRTHLSHGFTNQNTRHDRVIREMALKKRFVERYILDADDPFVTFDLKNPVN